MTVKELIEKLKEYPEDMQIEWWDAEWDMWYVIKEIKLKYVIVDKTWWYIKHSYFDEKDEEYRNEIKEIELHKWEYSEEEILVID